MSDWAMAQEKAPRTPTKSEQRAEEKADAKGSGEADGGDGSDAKGVSGGGEEKQEREPPPSATTMSPSKKLRDEVAQAEAGGPELEAEIRKAFDFFDADKDGRISVDELKVAMGVAPRSSKPGEVGAPEAQFQRTTASEYSKEDIALILREADVDRDGFISYEDFRITYLAEKNGGRAMASLQVPIYERPETPPRQLAPVSPLRLRGPLHDDEGEDYEGKYQGREVNWQAHSNTDRVSWRGKSLYLNLYVTTGPGESGQTNGKHGASPTRLVQWWPGCNDMAEGLLAEHDEPMAVHQNTSWTALPDANMSVKKIIHSNKEDFDGSRSGWHRRDEDDRTRSHGDRDRDRYDERDRDRGFERHDDHRGGGWDRRDDRDGRDRDRDRGFERHGDRRGGGWDRRDDRDRGRDRGYGREREFERGRDMDRGRDRYERDDRAR